MNELKGTYWNGFESINSRKLESDLVMLLRNPYIYTRIYYVVAENFGKMSGRVHTSFIHSIQLEIKIC